MKKTSRQLDDEIARYMARRPSRQSALGGDLSDDEYVSIVRFLQRKRIPFAPYSGVIIVRGKKIASPADAMRILGWSP